MYVNYISIKLIKNKFLKVGESPAGKQRKAFSWAAEHVLSTFRVQRP